MILQDGWKSWQTIWNALDLLALGHFSRASMIFCVKKHLANKFIYNLARFNRRYTRFFSLLMPMIFFLLLKQTVPNFDTRYLRTSVIYVSANKIIVHEVMRIWQKPLCLWFFMGWGSGPPAPVWIRPRVDYFLNALVVFLMLCSSPIFHHSEAL